MFCPNCGANLPEGSGFCSYCGTVMNAAQPEQPAYQQPVYQQQAYQQPAYAYQPQPAVSKSEYLKTLASPNAKTLVKIAWGLLAVCVLILALGWNSSVNGPFYEIPVFKMVLGADYTEAMGELTDMLDESEDGIDELRDLYEDEIEENDLEKLVDSAEKMAKNPSLNNIKDVAEQMNKYNIDDMDAELVAIFDVAIAVLTICFGVVALFTVLGGVFKSAGLTIFALVLSVPICGLFSGVLYIVLALVAYIAQTVVLSKINKEYKAYKNGQQPAYGY